MLHQEGIAISKSSVQRIVSTWRKQNDPQKEIFIQQVLTIGPVCEFDWGCIHLKIQGVPSRFSAVFIVLRGSLYRYAKIYPRESSQFVIQAHMDFFHHIGGVPDIIRYDNLKTIISDSVRKTVNSTFLRFAAHYGFQVSACNRESPEEPLFANLAPKIKIITWVHCIKPGITNLATAVLKNTTSKNQKNLSICCFCLRTKKFGSRDSCSRISDETRIASQQGATV